MNLTNRAFKNKHDFDSETIDKIDASQLKNVSNNDVSVYDRVDDTSRFCET